MPSLRRDNTSNPYAVSPGARLEPGRFLGRTVRKRQVGDLMLAEVRYTAGAQRHAHERAYFCLIRRGSYTERYTRRTRVCRPMMLVSHPPGEQHAVTLNTDRVVSCNVELGPEWLRRMREYDLPFDQPAECEGGAPVELAMRLAGELERDDGASSLAIESLTLEILSPLARKTRVAASRMPSWLRDLPDLVDTQVRRPPALRALAAEVGVHPVYLAAVFRRFYGCSLGEYARRRRLDYARRQVANLELPLAQIAADAGFADQSHLTRMFKRFTGLTPGQYRTFLAFKTRRPFDAMVRTC